MNVDIRHSRESGNPDPSPAEFADAAAWVARLHGPNRSIQVERGLRRWLDEHPAHTEAFEAMTAAWEITGKLPRQPFTRVSRWQRVGYRQGFFRSVLAVAGISALALAALFYVQRHEGVTTGVGEQRVLALEDGSRITLNTDTRVKVEYDEQTRRVELKSGEALFEVAKRSNRPFIVTAGDRLVRALGTSFVVRRDADEVEVTLVEGKVAVAALSSAPRITTPLPLPGEGKGAGSSITLTAGQRLTFTEKAPPKVDTPPIDKVTAWRRGLVDFEKTPLADAVAEMNRYSATKLVVEDPHAAGISITGVFRAGDAGSLAAAVARAYGLKVVESGNGIRLARDSSGPQ